MIITYDVRTNKVIGFDYLNPDIVMITEEKVNRITFPNGVPVNCDVIKLYDEAKIRKLISVIEGEKDLDFDNIVIIFDESIPAKISFFSLPSSSTGVSTLIETIFLN